MLELRPPVPLFIRSDPAGDGHFGAPRGDRLHKGIDLLTVPGAPVYSPSAGTVIKVGYPYEASSYRYVEVSNEFGSSRVFYVQPHGTIFPGRILHAGNLLGYAQAISDRYPNSGMRDHIHLEVKINGEILLGRGRRPLENVWINPLAVLREAQDGRTTPGTPT